MTANEQLPARRKTKVPFTLQALAKDYTEDAFQTILEIMNNPDVENGIRLEAAKQVLDRGWGKAAVQIKAETIKYTLADVEKKLLENKAEIDARWEEAKRIEHDKIRQYITDDAEIIEEPASCSITVLQNNEEGGRSSLARLQPDSDENPLHDMETTGRAGYGSYPDSQTKTDIRDDINHRNDIQALD